MAGITEKIFIDVETYSEVDLKECGVYRYADDPSFEVMLFAFAYGDDPVKVIDIAQGEKIPFYVLDDLYNSEVLKLAHNANFEITCLSRWFGKELPPEQWECTAVRASTLGLPRSLAGVGDALGLKEDEKKMAIGKRLVQYFARPCLPTKTNGGRRRNFPHHEPEKWALYKEYNAQDVVTERAIYKAMERYPATIQRERELWWLDQRINSAGVLVDRTLTQNIINYSERHKQERETRAREISGIENPSSFPQIRKWLKTKRLDPDALDKDAVRKLIEELGDTEPDVVEFLRIRQELGKTSVTKYEAIARAVCRDGRIRGMLQFYGANRTGRWCLAEGTLILTDRGEIPIEKVTTDMRLWDGENWVSHDGVVYVGDKDVIEWDGIVATPDHEVFINEHTKITLQKAKEDGIQIWKGNSPYTK